VTPDLARPYLLFLGDVEAPLAIKMARGVAKWRPEWCVGQHRLAGCPLSLGLPDMTPPVVNAGGFLPDRWIEPIVNALDAGLDVVSGMHQRLASSPAIAEAAERTGRRLVDLRHSERTFATGDGAPRSGRRLLTVGTDCGVGKMYTALALTAGLRAGGIESTFRATGQTGILIAGGGIAVDAVVADFVAGAAEALTPAAPGSHWDVVEGQGSLYHPAYAGVTLGLLHGTQPDAYVVCSVPGRSKMRHVDRAPPSPSEIKDLTDRLGAVTQPAIQCVGVSLNTSSLEASTRAKCLDDAGRACGVPAVDPMIDGVDAILDEMSERGLL